MWVWSLQQHYNKSLGNGFIDDERELSSRSVVENYCPECAKNTVDIVGCGQRLHLRTRNLDYVRTNFYIPCDTRCVFVSGSSFFETHTLYANLCERSVSCTLCSLFQVNDTGHMICSERETRFRPRPRDLGLGRVFGDLESNEYCISSAMGHEARCPLSLFYYLRHCTRRSCHPALAYLGTSVHECLGDLPLERVPNRKIAGCLLLCVVGSSFPASPLRWARRSYDNVCGCWTTRSALCGAIKTAFDMRAALRSETRDGHTAVPLSGRELMVSTCRPIVRWTL